MYCDCFICCWAAYRLWSIRRYLNFRLLHSFLSVCFHLISIDIHLCWSRQKFKQIKLILNRINGKREHKLMWMEEKGREFMRALKWKWQSIDTLRLEPRNENNCLFGKSCKFFCSRLTRSWYDIIFNLCIHILRILRQMAVFICQSFFQIFDAVDESS